MNSLQLKKTTPAAIEALEKVAELYPWKVPGNRDSYSQYNEAWQDALDRAEGAIGNLPSAQPEIIRCRDCKHRTSYWGNCKLLEEKYHQTVRVGCDEFCSSAERRTDG